MQAIKTKYIGPSNVRGSRVKAECEAMTIIVSWDDALDTEANHVAAAKELCARLAARNEKLIRQRQRQRMARAIRDRRSKE